MADHQARLDELCSTGATPIAQLQPDIPDSDTRVVDGVITITWPYSVVTKSISFILAEHDVRLRRDKGQIRVEFHGAAGKALADSGVGGGDGIRISLAGVEWASPDAKTKLPGTALEWQMKFTKQVLLEIRRAESQKAEIIQVNAPDGEAEPLLELPPPTSVISPAIEFDIAASFPQTPQKSFSSKRLASSAFESGEYASPAFLKRARVSYGSLFEDGFDIFNEGSLESKSKKRSRFSMNATPWRYSSRSPSPEAKESPEQEMEPDNKLKEASPMAEKSNASAARSPMVNEHDQKGTLDQTPSIAVPVAADSQLATSPLPSPSTSAWLSINKDSSGMLMTETKKLHPSQVSSPSAAPQPVIDTNQRVGLLEDDLRFGLTHTENVLHEPSVCQAMAYTTDLVESSLMGNKADAASADSSPSIPLKGNFDRFPIDHHHDSHFDCMNYIPPQISYPVISDDQLPNRTFHPASHPNDSNWSAENYATAASVTNRNELRGPIEIIDSSSPTREVCQSEEPEPMQTTNFSEEPSSAIQSRTLVHEEVSIVDKGLTNEAGDGGSTRSEQYRANTYNQRHYDDEMESGTESESSSDYISDDHSKPHIQEHAENAAELLVRYDESSHGEDESDDDEMGDQRHQKPVDSEDDCNETQDAEDGNDPSTMSEEGGNENEYSGNRYADYEDGEGVSEEEGEEDYDEEDEEEEYDEDDEPAPMAHPSVPQEPVFISLLSDSEDEDSDESNAKDSDQDVDDDTSTREDEEATNSQDEPADESSSKAFPDEVDMNETDIEATTIPAIGRFKGPSQIDGCMDDIPDERDVAEVVAARQDAAMGSKAMHFTSNKESHLPHHLTRERTNSEEVNNSLAPDYTKHSSSETRDALEDERKDETDAPAQEGLGAEGVSDSGMGRLIGMSQQNDLEPTSPGPSENENPILTNNYKENYELAEKKDMDLPDTFTPDITVVDPQLWNQSHDASMQSKLVIVEAPELPAELPTPMKDAEMHSPVVQEDTEMKQGEGEENGGKYTEQQDTVMEEQSLEDSLPKDETDRVELSKTIVRQEDTQDVEMVALLSPPITQLEHSEGLPALEIVTEDEHISQKSELPLESTPASQGDTTEHTGEEQQYIQEDADTMAAEQQLLSEFQEHHSPSLHRQDKDDRSSTVSASVETPTREYVKKVTPKPEPLITVHSLRSHCRTHRNCGEASTDPSITLAKASMSPTRLNHDKDSSPITNIRIRGNKTDEADPSLILAAASRISPTTEHHEHAESPSVLRVAREKTEQQHQDPSLMLAKNKNASPEPDSADKPSNLSSTDDKASPSTPSVLLAKEPVTPTKTGSPEDRSPTALLRAAHQKKDVVEQDKPIVAHDAEIAHEQDTARSPRQARSKPQKLQPSDAPNSSGAGALKSPSITESLPEDETVSALKLQLQKCLRTKLGDYLPLKSLRNSLTKTVDIMAVSTTTPPQPHRPKHGPRDYMLELTLTDASVAPSGVSVAHIFRPHQASLPVVQAGDILLLRRVHVVSMQGRGFGVRVGDASAWAVFEKGDEEMLPQIKGPPVEVMDEEVEYAQSLRRWWGLQDAKALTKIDKASSKVTQGAKDEVK